MTQAVVGPRTLSIHRGHEVLLKLEKAGLGEGEAQAIVESRDNALAETLVEVVRLVNVDKSIILKIKQFLSANTVSVGKYANEEVESSYTYPKEYTGPKSIAKQVDRLAELFGLSLGYTSEYIEKVLPTLTLPKGAEGWFAIPSLDALAARFFADVEDPEERYCRAVQLLLDKVASLRSFYNYRSGEITPKHLRLISRTLEAFKQIAATQNGDIWIIPAQLGLRHRGRSIRLAWELFTSDEFGLDALSVLAITLTHPERFVRLEQLHIDIAGNEWSLGGGGEFAHSAYLSFSAEKLKFGCRLLDNPSDSFGSASGFVVASPS